MAAHPWIIDEMKRWPTERSSIQERFFRIGLFTYLEIQSDASSVTWQFTLRDLGMDHSFGRKFVVVDEDLVVDTATGEGVKVTDANVLANVVFGHFNKHLREMYEQLGCNVAI